MPPGSRRHLLCLFVAFVVLGACGEERGAHPENLGDVLKAHASGVTNPAVTVDGRPVGSSDFRAFWDAHPTLERSEAVDAFVEHEVLFGTALQRGVADDREVAVARKRAMVRKLLAETVEADVTRETLEASDIDAMAELVAAEAGYSEGLRASHLLVSVPKKKELEKKGSTASRDALYKDARSFLEEIRASLPDEPSAYDLVVARREFASEVQEPLSIEVNAHLKFPVESDAPGSVPEQWINVVDEFRKPAVEAARRGEYGVLSEPVRTPFGWHVIVVHEALPGEKPDPDAVRDVATARMLEKKRAEKVSEYYSKWSESSDTRTFRSVIEESEELK